MVGTTRIALALVGPGLVGGALLAQIAAQQAQPTNLDRLASHMSTSLCKHRTVIDCSGAEDVADQYLKWMKAGFHIVTPNKKLGSGDLSRYKQLREYQRQHGVHFFYEATVGAGLPVMSTLRTLVETGDKVQRIEGVLSGTLSYLFNNFNPSTSFSELVSTARTAGYTEPDPRDDLSGLDVARKVIILARECGLSVGLDELQLQSLVSSTQQQAATVEEYMARLPESDAELSAMASMAEATGEVLRYVGAVDVEAGSCSVGLRRLPKAHPLAQLQGTDNMISFTTERYSKQPLIVRGPGAGAQVTAAGIFGDLMQLARCLGAPS